MRKKIKGDAKIEKFKDEGYKMFLSNRNASKVIQQPTVFSKLDIRRKQAEVFNRWKEELYSRDTTDTYISDLVKYFDDDGLLRFDEKIALGFNVITGKLSIFETLKTYRLNELKDIKAVEVIDKIISIDFDNNLFGMFQNNDYSKSIEDDVTFMRYLQIPENPTRDEYIDFCLKYGAFKENRKQVLEFLDSKFGSQIKMKLLDSFL